MLLRSLKSLKPTKPGKKRIWDLWNRINELIVWQNKQQSRASRWSSSLEQYWSRASTEMLEVHSLNPAWPSGILTQIVLQSGSSKIAGTWFASLAKWLPKPVLHFSLQFRLWTAPGLRDVQTLKEPLGILREDKPLSCLTQVIYWRTGWKEAKKGPQVAWHYWKLKTYAIGYQRIQ